MADETLMREVACFIRHLVSAVSSSLLYSPDHRQVRRLRTEALVSLESALAIDGEIVIMLIEDDLVCNSVQIDGSLCASKFIQLFAAKGNRHITFLRDVVPGELGDLIAALSRHGEIVPEEWASAHIRLGGLKLDKVPDDSSDPEEEDAGLLSLEVIRFHEHEAFREIYECMRDNRKFGMRKINGIVRSLVHAFSRMSMPLLAYSVLSSLDRYTFIHSTNVCILNLAQSMAMGIEGSLLHDIGVAGMMHDIGKLLIPEEILSKPDKLSDEEWQVIMEHPVRGAHYLLDQPGVPRLAVVCAYEHHMKYDGSGYPKVQEGWQQNICSQMTTVSDCFDALRTRRVYRDSVDYDTIAAMMLDGSGTHFHPVLTRNFLRILASRHKDFVPSGGEETPASQHRPSC